jgi:hypothetical protein
LKLWAADALRPDNSSTPSSQPIEDSSSDRYFAGLAVGLPPPDAPEVYGIPGVAACSVTLNSLKAERDPLLVKTDALRQTLPLTATFQGIAAKLKSDTSMAMELSQ